MKLVELASGLHGRGHSVRLIAPHSSPLITRSFEQGVPATKLNPKVKYLDFSAASQLRSIFARQGTEFAIIGQSGDISTVRLATVFKPLPSLVYLQQMQFDLPKRDPLHRWMYSKLDYWLTLTEKMRESVIRNTTVSPQRIITFPIGSNLSRYDPLQYDSQHERRRLSLPIDAPIVAVVGRLDPQKGQTDFIRAASLVLRNHPDAHFLIVGEETKGESGFTTSLHRLIDELNLRHAVRFLPSTDDVPRLLAAIDILVLPSHAETFGYIVVEAMAMGKPVVATNAGGVPEIIEDGKSGLLFPPRDAQGMADHIVELLRNPEMYSGIASEARRRAASQFDFRVQMTRLEEMLSSLKRP